VDGTKIHANASKHSAVSYKRASELIAKAEDVDSKPLEAGLTIPEEIKRKEERHEEACCGIIRIMGRYRALESKNRGQGQPVSPFAMKRNRLPGGGVAYDGATLGHNFAAGARFFAKSFDNLLYFPKNTNSISGIHCEWD
jgi:hypothetical protein